MKIFVPSWGRPDTICTHKLFPKGTDFKVALHSTEDWKWYSRGAGLKVSNVIVSHLGYGHAAQRNWILDKYVRDREWVVMADDNITALWMVQEPFYNESKIDTSTMDSRFWHNAFQHNMTWRTFMDKLINEDIPEADRRGAWLIGYGTNTSPLFRKQKYRDVGYVKGKLFAVRKSHVRHDEHLMSKVDFEFTAAHLAAHGRVLINNFIFPVAQHFAKGGIGTVKERTPMNLYGCAYLMKKYPGLFAYEEKPGRQTKSEIKFTMTRLDQIEKWRKTISPSEKKVLAFSKGKTQE